jgi:hypothetical protein
MHRARVGGLAPSFIAHSPSSSIVPRRFRSRSSINATKASKQAWKDTAQKFLQTATATSRRSGLYPARTHRATELRLVNSILEEQRLPVAREQGSQDAVQPMTGDTMEGTSKLPPGIGPGALVEIRW